MKEKPNFNKSKISNSEINNKNSNIKNKKKGAKGCFKNG